VRKPATNTPFFSYKKATARLGSKGIEEKLMKTSPIGSALVLALASTCIFSTAVLGQDSVNPGFDFKGIEAFWEIVDILEADKEPTEVQWNRFFEAPGYKRLQSEFNRPYFQNAITAVFMPSRRDLKAEFLDEYRQRGGFLAWYTPLVIEGFEKACRDRKWLMSRIEELKTYPYLEKAASLALRYLPEDETNVYPEVDFIIFSDSRGYSPLIIGLTGKEDLNPDELACLERQGRDKHFPFLLHMAHESFHLYREKEKEIEFPEEDHPDYPVIWILDQIENEGIGDLINRKELYWGDGCLVGTERADQLRKEQNNQPATIRVMDTIFSEMADDPQLVDGMGKQLQSFVPQSGHPTGFYMARIIEEELGPEAIVGVVRNPFRFFTTYNEAAEKNGMAPVFSAKAISFIRSLESIYAHP
jgi:hypothetical protein